jgi:predicted nucleic acid-binding Zn ribbon protein
MKPTPKRPCAKCGKKFDHLILQVSSYPCVSLCQACSEEARRVFNRWMAEPQQLAFEFEEVS